MLPFDLLLTLLLLLLPHVSGKRPVHHQRKKVEIKYEYLPQDYKDPKTVICTKPQPPSKGGGGSSIWGYLTAGIVATTVAANIVNNANENNNNNNNNNNQDNTNSNNMNIGNSDNNNMNMNLLIPGRRSFPTESSQTNDNIQNKTLGVLCPFLAGPPHLSDYRAVIDRIVRIAAALLLPDSLPLDLLISQATQSTCL